MHNGDRDGSPSEAGLICGHWIMPMLWSGGRTDKILNKLAGGVARLGGSMVEHQPRLLGSRVRFRLGRLRYFSVSAKASLPISLPPSLPLSFSSSSFPFLFLPLRPFVCASWLYVLDSALQMNWIVPQVWHCATLQQWDVQRKNTFQSAIE